MANGAINENALITLQKRYFLRDENDNFLEDWGGLCRRVADFIATDEEENEKEFADLYFDLIYSLRFVPNTPTLMNAGKENGQLAACFVLGIEDNMTSIMKTATDAAFIHKSGGGTGFDFSKLRPADSRVSTTTGAASGPISFMRMYNNITEEIKQGGTRRGANMGILRVDHPDILAFIQCKSDTTQITNFNISVAITDKFMKALEKDQEYDLYDPHLKKNVSKLRARVVWDLLCKSSHATGEPGVVFIDTINKKNQYGTISATNPCGEQPLRDNESCNLGSIVVSKYVEDGNFKYPKLKKDVRLAVRFLDSVVSLNAYPIDEIRKTHHQTRKIGLGIMGLADTFIKMGIVYGSEESYKVAGSIYKVVYDESRLASEYIGDKKGTCDACKELKLKRRNFWTTTVAPTGSISIIAGCSSGIEPIYNIIFEKNVLDGERLYEYNEDFKRAMTDKEVEVGKELREKILKAKSVQDIKEIPSSVRQLFVTAHDLTYEQHVKMQSIFQKYSDSGVSKTINMAETATIEDVSEAYLLAYKLGCKGITVYRDNSRENQPLSSGKEEDRSRKKYNRTSVMTGTTEKIKTPFGSLYCTINDHSHGEPGEVILNIGKSGADINAIVEAVGRLTSVALQHGIPVDKLGKTLKDIKGEDAIRQAGGIYSSIPDFVGSRLIDKAKEKDKEDVEAILAPCPSCGARLFRGEGCLSCRSCGYSKC